MPLIATDGSSLGTPTDEGRKAEGPGAYAVVIRFEPDHPRAPGFSQTLTGGRRSTTTGEIELLGFLAALEAVRAHHEARDADPDAAMIRPEERFTIVVDSEYVAKGWREHLDAWIANEWRTSSFRAIKHQILWQDVQDIRASHGHLVHVVHQPGHTRKATDVDVNPYVDANDAADKAAGIASRAIRDGGPVPKDVPIVWLRHRDAADRRPADVRRLAALAQRVISDHGRDAAVEAFRIATHATGTAQ